MNLGNIDIADLWLGAIRAKSAWIRDVQVWSDAPAYLCFTAEQANSTVKLSKVGYPAAISLEYSYNGSSWSDYTWPDSTGDTLTLSNVGDKVYMRAKGENSAINSDTMSYYNFFMTGKVAASGNIQTLLKADGSADAVSAYAYINLFNGCSSLTQAPALPATTLASNCYSYMFQGCSSLTAAPRLPATTLASQCYSSMFENCTALVNAPVLPATTLVEGCYSGMFKGCSSLLAAPDIAGAALANNCCYSMFENCTSLSAAPVSLGTSEAPYQCCIAMFKGCTSLTDAPKLPAVTVGGNAYGWMFENCTSLSSVKVGFTSWPSGGTPSWLNNVAASGTFTCPAELPDTRGTSNIPEGWTKVDNIYPTNGLKLHFDAIDNSGVGTHLSSTTDWANIAPDTSADYKMVRTSGSWEDDSAVFTGAYNECFWLNTSAGQQVASLSATGLLTDSWTYALAFYYDSSTLENYRGYIGKEVNYNDYCGNIYLKTIPTGVILHLRGKSSNNTWNDWDSDSSNLKFNDYLTQNSFNTLAFSWDESTSTVKLYANGQKFGEVTQPADIATNTVQGLPLALGGGVQSYGSNRVCKGKIHDFLIYSRVLTDNEVSQIHSWQSARFNS